MSDQEIYKITFDIDAGMASDINQLNSQLARIQPLAIKAKNNFGDKVEQASLIAAFASGLKTERTKASAAKVENRVLRQVVFKDRPVEQKKSDNNMIPYSRFLELQKSYEIDKKVRFQATAQTIGYLKQQIVLKNREIKAIEIKATKDIVAVSRSLQKIIRQKDNHIAKLNQALDAVYNRIYFLSKGQIGGLNRKIPQRISDVGMDLTTNINDLVRYTQAAR